MEEKIKQVKGYVLGDGKVIVEKDLNKYEIRKEEKEGLVTAQASEEAFEGLYSGDVQKPPNNPYKLAQLLTMSSDHYRCCKQKSTDIVGLGWEIVLINKNKKADNDIEKITDFFKQCGGDETFIEVLKKFWMDYESIGWGNLEIVKEHSDSGKGKDGDPERIYHIPAYTMRKSIDRNRYYQIRNEDEKVIFRKVNLDKVLYSKQLIERKIMEENKLKVSYHEIMEISNYNPLSTYYGIPDVLPASGAILGNLKTRDFNLDFFDNNAIPRYAVIVEGGMFSSNVKQIITQYFQTGIRGQAHKTLVLEVDSKEVKIHFEKLAVDIQDGSFRLYRQDNRDEIIRVHGVPPRWLGIAEAGHLGGTEEGRNQSENYIHAYVQPMQEILSHRLTRNIIQEGFGISTVKIKFFTIDIKDRKTESEIIDRYLSKGVYSLDEIRTKFLNESPIEGGLGAKHVIFAGKTPIFLEDLGKETEEVVKQQNKWMQGVFEKLREDLRHLNKSESVFSKMFKKK